MSGSSRVGRGGPGVARRHTSARTLLLTLLDQVCQRLDAPAGATLAPAAPAHASLGDGGSRGPPAGRERRGGAARQASDAQRVARRGDAVVCDHHHLHVHCLAWAHAHDECRGEEGGRPHALCSSSGRRVLALVCRRVAAPRQHLPVHLHARAEQVCAQQVRRQRHQVGGVADVQRQQHAWLAGGRGGDLARAACSAAEGSGGQRRCRRRRRSSSVGAQRGGRAVSPRRRDRLGCRHGGSASQGTHGVCVKARPASTCCLHAPLAQPPRSRAWEGAHLRARPASRDQEARGAPPPVGTAAVAAAAAAG